MNRSRYTRSLVSVDPPCSPIEEAACVLGEAMGCSGYARLEDAQVGPGERDHD